MEEDDEMKRVGKMIGLAKANVVKLSESEDVPCRCC